MQHRIKKEHKIDYIKDICNRVENGGEITMEHKTKLIDVSEQHSIDKVIVSLQYLVKRSICVLQVNGIETS